MASSAIAVIRFQPGSKGAIFVVLRNSSGVLLGRMLL
jgi:hypothetical protein